MRIERELMRGAGPVAVLKLLEDGPKYGYELLSTLEQQTQGVLDIGQASLYSMLYHLEGQGFVEGFEEVGATGRVRKYYRLTAKGEQRLAHDVAQWHAVFGAMRQIGILGAMDGGAA